MHDKSTDWYKIITIRVLTSYLHLQHTAVHICNYDMCYFSMYLYNLPLYFFIFELMIQTGIRGRDCSVHSRLNLENTCSISEHYL